MLENHNPYDSGSKRLITLCPQDLISWVHKTAVFKEHGTGEFKSLPFEADAIQICTIGDEPAIIHLEIQSKGDNHMQERLLEYNSFACRYHDYPVFSYVIYLRTGGKRFTPPLVRIFPDGREVVRFNYETIELGAMRCEELFEKNLPGLLPLVPFTENGATREVIEQIITLLTTNDDTMNAKELLALTHLFASLAFKSSDDQQWLERRFKMLDDILSEAPAYQSIKRQGVEEGLEQARQLRLNFSRQMLSILLEDRFPKLHPSTKKIIAQITRPDVLEDLTIKLTRAKDYSEAQEAFLIVAAASNDQADAAS